MIKFNEWLTQNKNEDQDLIESQLDQWVDKLMGLLHTIPLDKKQKLIEKVINNIRLKL